MGYDFSIVGGRRNKWLFSPFTSIMGECTIFAMFLKGLRCCIQTTAFITQAKASLPFTKTNTVPSNQLGHLEELQNDSGLALFQPKVWHQLWNQVNQYGMFESKYMVSPSQPCLSKMNQDWANIVGNSYQKALACLRDANAYSQTVVTNALAIVITLVQVNSKLTFPVHDTGKVRKLCWGQLVHNASLNGVVTV